MSITGLVSGFDREGQRARKHEQKLNARADLRKRLHSWLPMKMKSGSGVSSIAWRHVCLFWGLKSSPLKVMKDAKFGFRGIRAGSFFLCSLRG